MKTVFRRITLLLLSLLGVLMLGGAAITARGAGTYADWADSHLGVVDTRGQLSPKVANQLQGASKRILSQYGVYLTVFMEPAPGETPLLSPKEAWVFLEGNTVTVYTGAHVRRVLKPLQLEEFQEKWMMPSWKNSTFSVSVTDWKAQNILTAVESLLALKNGDPVPDSLVLYRYLHNGGRVESQVVSAAQFWSQQQKGRMGIWGVYLGCIAFLSALVFCKAPEGTVPGDGSNFKGGIGSGMMGLTTTQSTSGYTSGTGGLTFSPK